MPVHLRLNDKDTSRNPFINFVTALPGQRHDESLRRLQQLAAMAKPLMQQEGFHINSLEEYEWNREFAGRCWNNGEVIELVLRNSNGQWIPLQFVLFVFCHELAHIKHMNHIPKLHGALTRKLKELALEKQSQGYFGDGMWSAGRQLENGGFVSGIGMQRVQSDLPEHVCGGAFSRRRLRGSGKRRRRTQNGKKRKFKGPSLHTGAQTAAHTRGGNRRITLDVAENSSGNRVDGRDWIPTASAKDSSYKKDENSTFRKRTQTKDAREKRANAALARFATLSESASNMKKEDEKKINREDLKPIDSIFRKHSIGNNSRENKVKVEIDKRQTLSSDTSDEEESETESEDEGGEEDLDGDDSIYVGNDLPSDDFQFTQASNESQEKRKRRMDRFNSRQDQESTSNLNEWDSLLNEEGRKDEPIENSKENEIIDIQDSSSEEEVVLVEGMPLKKTKNEDEEDIVQTEGAAKATWTCLLCTLGNNHSDSRCAACDTSKGQRTLGA